LLHFFLFIRLIIQISLGAKVWWCKNQKKNKKGEVSIELFKASSPPLDHYQTVPIPTPIEHNARYMKILAITFH